MSWSDVRLFDVGDRAVVARDIVVPVVVKLGMRLSPEMRFSMSWDLYADHGPTKKLELLAKEARSPGHWRDAEGDVSTVLRIMRDQFPPF